MNDSNWTDPFVGDLDGQMVLKNVKDDGVTIIVIDRVSRQCLRVPLTIDEAADLGGQLISVACGGKA